MSDCTSVDVREVGGAPRIRVAPNPFGSEVRITFAMSRAGNLRAVVHDLQGRVVRRLYDGAMPAGIQGLAWDGRDARGIPVASGVYWISTVAEGRTMTTRVSLLR